MTSYPGRNEVKLKTEALFQKCSLEQFTDMEKELIKLGYVQRGADPASAEFYHGGAGLLLDIGFEEDGLIHSYELLTTEEMKEKQRKFRW